MPWPRTDLGCNATKKKSHSALNHKEMPCHSPGDFCTASHREDQGIYPGHSLWVLWWKKWQGEEFSPYVSVAMSDYHSIFCMFFVYHKGTDHWPTTGHRQIIWPSHKIWFLWWTKWHCQRSFPECFNFPLIVIPMHHSHSSTVDITLR